MLRVTPKVQIQMAGAGPLKFTRSTYPTIYRIVQVVRGQGFAYRIVDHEDPARRLEIEQPVGAGRLVKLDMAELEARPGGPKRIEICQADGDTYAAATLDRVALDGRVRIRYDSAPTRPLWIDLKDKRYRWLADVGAPMADPDPAEDVVG